jgi:hypothetical protein
MFPRLSRPALRPTYSPTQRVTGALSLTVKRPEHEPDHSPVSPLLPMFSWCAQRGLFIIDNYESLSEV